MQDFVKCFNPGNRHKLKETQRFRKFGYQEIEARDKTNPDIFWLKDDSLGAGLNSFKEIIATLNGK